MIGAFLALVRRDVGLAWRRGGDAMFVLTFFVVAVALFPLGVGPEPNILARIAPGVIWACALFSAMLSLERLFAQDYEDGALDHLRLSPIPLELLVLAKMLAHWLTTGAPLLLMAPILGVMLSLPEGGYGALATGMALGTPILSALGGVGAALVLGARRGGVLLSLLVLPMTIPVLIFGVAAVDAAAAGLPARPHLLLLAGMTAGAITLCPFAAAAGLRQATH